MRMYLLLVTMVAVGCGGSATGSISAPAPPPAAPSALPALTFEGKVASPDESRPSPDFIAFIDGDRALFGSLLDLVLEIDAQALRERARKQLSSKQVTDPTGRPGVGDYLVWKLSHARWAWDPAAAGPLGVVALGARGRAHSGLAIWAPASGAPPVPLVPADGAMPCWPVAISPDRTRVAVRVARQPADACDETSAIQVFAVATASAVTPPLDLGGARAAAFSGDGRYLAAGASALHVYDLREGKVVEKLASREIRAIAFHPSAPMLAWTSAKDDVQIWRADDRTVRRPRVEGDTVAFSPDGRYLATSGHEGLSLLDTNTFVRVAPPSREVVRHGSTDPHIAFSSDSRRLALSRGGELGLWRLGPPAAAAPSTPAAPSDWLARVRPLPIPAPPPNPPLEYGGALSGRVTANGKPVAGAEIALQAHHQEYGNARALPVQRARTTAAGRYRFANLPRITWSMLVTAPGLQRDGRVIVMRESRVHTADVRLEPAATITGTIVGPDGKPARDVRLLRYSYDSSIELDVTAPADGRFVIDHLRPESRYVLLARRADGAVRSTTFDLSKPGRVPAKITLLAPDAPRVLRAIVVDPAGAPIEGATVVVNEMQAGPTDAQGHFSIDVDGGLTRGIPVRVWGVARSDHVGVDLPQTAPVTIRATR